MSYVKITNAPPIQDKYGLKNGQVKRAYADKTGRALAPRRKRDVWVASDVPGDRVLLFSREFEWLKK